MRSSPSSNSNLSDSASILSSSGSGSDGESTLSASDSILSDYGSDLDSSPTAQLGRMIAINPDELKLSSLSPNVLYIPISDRNTVVFSNENILNSITWALTQDFDCIVVGSTGIAQCYGLAAEEYLAGRTPDIYSIQTRAEKMERQKTSFLITETRKLIAKKFAGKAIMERWKSGAETVITPGTNSTPFAPKSKTNQEISKNIAKLNKELTKIGEPPIEEKHLNIDHLLTHTNTRIAGLAGLIKGIQNTQERQCLLPGITTEAEPFDLSIKLAEALNAKSLDGIKRVIILPLQVIVGSFKLNLAEITSKDLSPLMHVRDKYTSPSYAIAQRAFTDQCALDPAAAGLFHELININSEKRYRDYLVSHPHANISAKAKQNSLMCTARFFAWESPYFLMWCDVALKLKINIYVGYPLEADFHSNSIFKHTFYLRRTALTKAPDRFCYINFTSLMPERKDEKSPDAPTPIAPPSKKSLYILPPSPSSSSSSLNLFLELPSRSPSPREEPSSFVSPTPTASSIPSSDIFRAALASGSPAVAETRTRTPFVHHFFLPQVTRERLARDYSLSHYHFPVLKYMKRI